MTSNQFAFLVFILLLGFGGYLSHPIVPPEIGGPLVVLFILGVVVIAIGAVICDSITWWWRNTNFYINREIRRQETKEIERKRNADFFIKEITKEIERKRRQK
jgi:hypothetical protein